MRRLSAKQTGIHADNAFKHIGFTEDEYIKAVLFRAFVLFLQPGGISETEMKKLLLSHFGIQEYHNRI